MLLIEVGKTKMKKIIFILNRKGIFHHTGYCSGSLISNKKTPFSYGVDVGPEIAASRCKKLSSISLTNIIDE
jgi:hypothetical protein